MRTDLYAFEAALYHLLRVDARPSRCISTDQWPAVLSLADREQVAPLVHEAVAACTNIPESVTRALAQPYRRAGIANAEAYAQLAEVLRALSVAGVDPVLLKGAALARFTYRDAALRAFTDLDILVRPEHIEAAHQALCGAGYVIAGGRPSAADVAWRQARGYGDPAGRRLAVDLHWRYTGYPLLIDGDSTGVFARARPVDVDGQRAFVPAPEDMLVALGLHFARDLWYGKPRLRYLCDAAEVARRHPVAWHLLAGSARDMPLVRSPLSVMLEVARDLLGAAVPETTLLALHPRGRGRLQRYLAGRIRRGLLRMDRPSAAVLQIALLRWLDAPSAVAYARWLSGLFFVPRELAVSRRRWLRGFLTRRPPGVDLDG